MGGGEVVNFTRDITLLVGHFLDWVEEMELLNPINLAIGASIVALIALMIKFEGVADFVLDAFELLFLLSTGFQFIASLILETLAKIYTGLAKLYDMLGKVPGSLKAFFQQSADGAKNLATILDSLANKSFQGVFTQSQKMSEIFTTGVGDWAKGFQNLKTTTTSFFDAWKTGSDQFIESHKTMQNGVAGTISALGTLNSALQGAAANNKEFAIVGRSPRSAWRSSDCHWYHEGVG